MRASSASTAAATERSTFGAAAREGYPDTVATTVADLTGRPATPLREVLGLPEATPARP